MTPSILIRLALAALATAFLLPAQSAPAAPSQPSKARASQAESKAKAMDKVQTRLAEVISMLEEDDLSPEQRAVAMDKLKEIVARLQQDGKKATAPMLIAKNAQIETHDDHVVMRSKDGVYLVAPGKAVETREVEGFPVGTGGAVAELLVPDQPPKAPSAPKAPKAPKAAKAPKAPRAPMVLDVPSPPDAPEFPAKVEFRAYSESGQPMVVEGVPVPDSQPLFGRKLEVIEDPAVVVEGKPIEVLFEQPAEARWTEVKEKFEALREPLEEQTRTLKLRYRSLDKARAELDAAAKATFGAERARAFADQFREQADEMRRAAEAARDEAKKMASDRLRFVVERDGHVAKVEAEAAEAKAVEGARLRWVRAAKAETAAAEDGEIRALIDEMRAEMKQIRALMQELRTRSDRDEDDDSERKEVGVRAGSRAAVGRRVVNTLPARSEATVAAPLERTINVEGQQAEGSAATTEAAPRRVRVVRRTEGQSTGSAAAAGSSGTASGSGPSSSTTSASSSGGR